MLGRGVPKDWNEVPIKHICVLSDKDSSLFTKKSDAKNIASATISDRVSQKVESVLEKKYTIGDKCKLKGEVFRRGVIVDEKGTCEKKSFRGGAFTDSDNTSDLESVSEFDFYSDTSR